MSNLKVLKVEPLYSDTSIVIESKVGDEVHVFDVRVQADNKNKVSVRDVGKRTKKQRVFKYLNSRVSDDYSYRKLDDDGRANYFRKEMMKYAPVEVLNLALEEYVKSFTLNYLVKEDDEDVVQ